MLQCQYSEACHMKRNSWQGISLFQKNFPFPRLSFVYYRPHSGRGECYVFTGVCLSTGEGVPLATDPRSLVPGPWSFPRGRGGCTPGLLSQVPSQGKGVPPGLWSQVLSWGEGGVLQSVQRGPAQGYPLPQRGPGQGYNLPLDRTRTGVPPPPPLPQTGPEQGYTHPPHPRQDLSRHRIWCMWYVSCGHLGGLSCF